LGNDPVPNIRIKVSQTLKKYFSHVNEPSKSEIRNILIQLSQDKDKDVRDEANSTVNYLNI